MALVGRDRHHVHMRRQYTGKQRSQLVELVTGGQATVRAAAARLGVVPATAYCWLKRREVERRGARGRKGGTRVAGRGNTATFV